MRVGKDNRWGYSFKTDSGVSFEQEAILASHLGRLDGEYTHYLYSTLQPEDKRHYLPEDVKSIMGIGESNEPKSLGIVWSMNEVSTLECLFYAAIDQENDFYPYKINPGKRYYVIDGEVYEQ